MIATPNTLVKEERSRMRAADDQAYESLLKRGYTADAWAKGGREEYEKIEKTARERLVGRLYSRELLERVSKIARAGDGPA